MQVASDLHFQGVPRWVSWQGLAARPSLPWLQLEWIPTKATKIAWYLWSWQLIMGTWSVCVACVIVAQMWTWQQRPRFGKNPPWRVFKCFQVLLAVQSCSIYCNSSRAVFNILNYAVLDFSTAWLSNLFDLFWIFWMFSARPNQCRVGALRWMVQRARLQHTWRAVVQSGQNEAALHFIAC